MWELGILEWFESLHGTALDDALIAITHTGDYGLIWLVLGAAMLLSPRWRGCGIAVIACTAVAYAANEAVLKSVFCRDRPFMVEDFEMLIPCPSSYSFPSGHSAAAFAGATAVLIHSRRWGCAAMAYACLIGVSRVYLTVHWPTDVVAGACFGIMAAVAVTWCLSRWVPLYRRMDPMGSPFGRSPEKT